MVRPRKPLPIARRAVPLGNLPRTEDDRQCVAVRLDRMDPHRLARLGGRRDDRLGGEVEWDAEHVGILYVEQSILVEIIGLTAQTFGPHLLAQKLVPNARTPRI